MSNFTIQRTDCSARTELVADTADSVLHTISRLHFEDADVFRDGAYVFSVEVGEGGFWTIYQRDEAVEQYEPLG